MKKYQLWFLFAILFFSICLFFIGMLGSVYDAGYGKGWIEGYMEGDKAENTIFQGYIQCLDNMNVYWKKEIEGAR